MTARWVRPSRTRGSIFWVASEMASLVNSVTVASISAYLAVGREKGQVSQHMRRTRLFHRMKTDLKTLPMRLVTGTCRLMHLTRLSPSAEVWRMAAWNEAGLRSSSAPV